MITWISFCYVETNSTTLTAHNNNICFSPSCVCPLGLWVCSWAGLGLGSGGAGVLHWPVFFHLPQTSSYQERDFLIKMTTVQKGEQKNVMPFKVLTWSWCTVTSTHNPLAEASHRAKSHVGGLESSTLPTLEHWKHTQQVGMKRIQSTTTVLSYWYIFFKLFYTYCAWLNNFIQIILHLLTSLYSLPFPYSHNFLFQIHRYAHLFSSSFPSVSSSPSSIPSPHPMFYSSSGSHNEWEMPRAGCFLSF